MAFYHKGVELRVLTNDSLLKRIEAWQYLSRLEASALTYQKKYAIRKHVANLQSALTPEMSQALERQLLKLLIQACISTQSRIDVEIAVFVLGPAFMTSDASTRSELATWDGLCRLVIEDKELLSHDIFTWDLLKIRAGVVKHDSRRKRLMLEWTELSSTGITLLRTLPRKTRNALIQDKARWPKESQQMWNAWMNQYGRKGVLGHVKTIFDRR